MAKHVQGGIYLLHFDRPYRHASHYTGKPASSRLLQARRRVRDGQFSEHGGLLRPASGVQRGQEPPYRR
jgi:hypothetical protein